MSNEEDNFRYQHEVHHLLRPSTTQREPTYCTARQFAAVPCDLRQIKRDFTDWECFFYWG